MGVYRGVLWLVLFLSCTVGAHAAAAPGETWVIVVRHAEKAADDPRDPSLSDTGQRRAQALAGTLGNSGVQAIYTTQYRRTQLTAEPLSKQAGVAVSVRPVTADNAAGYTAALVSEIRAKHRGQTVLVVGHSNTVPEIVAALSGADAAPMQDSEYDRLTLVALPVKGKARIVVSRYGPAP